MELPDLIKILSGCQDLKKNISCREETKENSLSDPPKGKKKQNS